MSFDDPKVKYLMRNYRIKVPVPGHRDLLVEYADFILFEKDAKETTTQSARLSVPVRSNLYQFLNELLYSGDKLFQGDIAILEEQVVFLKVILQNQKDYAFWKEGLEIVREHGREKAWEWIHDSIPLLELRNRLK